MRKRLLLLILGTAALACLALALYLCLDASRAPKPDALLLASYANASKTTSYAQDVETRDVSSTGVLRISGLYLVDTGNAAYASFSTTTLSRATAPSVSFEIADISIKQAVYLKVTNLTPEFRLAVPASGSWVRFAANAIPDAYQNVAIAGPQANYLVILRDSGSYLSLVKRYGEENLDGTRYTHYAFTLSNAAKTATDPDIRSIVDRLGTNGTIDAWINASTTEIAIMRLSNGAAYTSTTTFSRFNEPLGISAPVSK